MAAVQLAKILGMKVIGTAGTQAGVDLVKKNGADWVFNHRDENYMDKIKHIVPDGVDLIVEMLANVNLTNDFKLLKPIKGKIGVG